MSSSSTCSDRDHDLYTLWKTGRISLNATGVSDEIAESVCSVLRLADSKTTRDRVFDRDEVE